MDYRNPLSRLHSVGLEDWISPVVKDFLKSRLKIAALLVLIIFISTVTINFALNQCEQNKRHEDLWSCLHY